MEEAKFSFNVRVNHTGYDGQFTYRESSGGINDFMRGVSECMRSL
jgi:hypothetical protein